MVLGTKTRDLSIDDRNRLRGDNLVDGIGGGDGDRVVANRGIGVVDLLASSSCTITKIPGVHDIGAVLNAGDQGRGIVEPRGIGR